MAAVRTQSSRSFARGVVAGVAPVFLLAVIAGLVWAGKTSDSSDERLDRLERLFSDQRIALADLRSKIWQSALTRVSQSQDVELHLRDLQSRQLKINDIRKQLDSLKPSVDSSTLVTPTLVTPQSIAVPGTPSTSTSAPSAAAPSSPKTPETTDKPKTELKIETEGEPKTEPKIEPES